MLLSAFNKVAVAFSAASAPADVGFKSAILNEIIFTLPRLREPVQGLISCISLKQAAEGNLANLWTDFEKYPKVADADMVCTSTGVHVHVLNYTGRVYKLWS